MRQDLPTGVVTLLFTDIEGSTRLLSELRGGYVDALAQHRRLIREAAAGHGGVEVDSQGDAFLLAFDRPTDAVAAAIDAQRRLAGGPVSVRMGIHTGEPELTDEGYVGLDVHRGARIGAAGHGGQVLLSAATRGLVDIEAVDLGEHRLAGIERPEHIYGVLADGLAREFPPLRASDASEPELPTWLTTFIGREAELAQVAERLADPEASIVTLVGPGGAGKTRLACEAGRRRWQDHGDHVAFASAIAVNDADGLLISIAAGIGFAVDAAHGAGRSVLDQLTDYLAHRPSLVIVDNVEHLADAGAVLAAIAKAAPGSTLLVTSRRKLGLTGEWVIEVGGLRGGAEPVAGKDATDPAIRLFLERARRAVPSLSVVDDDWRHIQRICALLDGMPLGIELAAAWTGTLSASELASELEQSFDVLDTSAADIPLRHRSLRAAFDGSWRLLDERQRAVFANMSVFVGTFDRSVAMTVAAADTPTIAELAARSLLRRREDGRFEIHELLRQYAARELAAAGREDELREAHARAFTRLVESSLDALISAASVETRARLAPDAGNLRAALEWAVTHWSLTEIERLMPAVSALWATSVDPVAGEIMPAIERAARDRRPATLDAGELVAARHVVAPHAAFALAIVDDNAGAEQMASESLAVLDAAGREHDAAICRMVLGINACNRFEDAQAIAPLEAADAVLRKQDDRLMRGEMLTWLGWARLMCDDLDGARDAFELAHDICTELGEPLAIAFTQSKLGLLEDSVGDYERALDLHLDAFSSFDAAGNRGGVGYALSRASLSAYGLGRHQAALDFALAAYAGFHDLNHHWGLIVVTGRLGYAYLGLDQPVEARRWALHSLELSQDGFRLGQLHALGAVAGAMARLGDPRGRPILQAVLDDDDMPGMFAIQGQAELDRLDPGPADETDHAGLDLDAIIRELLREPHPAPVLR